MSLKLILPWAIDKLFTKYTEIEDNFFFGWFKFNHLNLNLWFGTETRIFPLFLFFFLGSIYYWTKSLQAVRKWFFVWFYIFNCIKIYSFLEFMALLRLYICERMISKTCFQLWIYVSFFKHMFLDLVKCWWLWWNYNIRVTNKIESITWCH